MKQKLLAALREVVGFVAVGESKLVVGNTFKNLFKRTVKDSGFIYDWQHHLFEQTDEDFEETLDPKEIADYIGRDVSDDFDTDDDDWEEIAQEYIEKRYADFEQKFNEATVNKGQLEIYRCIAVDDPQEIIDQIEGNESEVDEEDSWGDKEESRGLGVYWAFTKKGAQCFWGSGDSNVLLTALVRAKDIDAERTVIVNLEPGGTEDEISIESGTDVTLIDVSVDDKSIWSGKKKVPT